MRSVTRSIVNSLQLAIQSDLLQMWRGIDGMPADLRLCDRQRSAGSEVIEAQPHPSAIGHNRAMPSTGASYILGPPSHRELRIDTSEVTSA